MTRTDSLHKHRRIPAAVFGVVAAVLSVLSVFSLPGTASAAGCGPAPAGQIAVMEVIDFGGGATARCVTVADGTRGAQALTAAGFSVRVQGGFVCAINGVPAQGCATSDASAPFWSYWHASPGRSWSYSAAGAFGYRLPARCAVEGWHYVDPSNKVPPSMSPPTVACNEASTPASTRAPAVTHPAAAPAQPLPTPGPATPPGPPRQSPPGPAAGSAPEASGNGAPSSGPAATGGNSDASSGGSGSGEESLNEESGIEGSGNAESGNAEKSDKADPDSDPSKDPESEESAGDAAESSAEDAQGDLASASAESDEGNDNKGSGSPAGVIVVLVLMGALGAALFVQRRKWTAPPE